MTDASVRELDAADGVPETAPFEGYDRAERRVGVRNRVLVLPSVICSHLVAERIADRVPEAVSAPHDHGCAQIGADMDQTERTFLGVGTNPNVAGTLVVGLGCEGIQSDRIAAQLADLGVPVQEVSIQNVGGSDPCIKRGVEEVESLVATDEHSRRTACLADLTIGVVSSDLRPGTRDQADPLVGGLVERIVDAGGRVVVAGSERLLPHADALADEYAATRAAASGLADLAERHRSVPPKETHVYRSTREATPEDVAAAWGGRHVRDVFSFGQRADHDCGVALLDAPCQFAEAATGLAAAGAQLVVHVTDDGVPTGHPIVPVVKVTGNDNTYAALSADIDVAASETSVDDLLERLHAVAAGEPSRAEDHGLTDFAITRVGPSM